MNLNQEIGLKEIGGMVFVIAIVAAVWSVNWSSVWAHVVWPFDRQPSMSLVEMMHAQGGAESYLAAHKRELCAWTRREELRNPGWRIRIAREQACGEARR